VTVDAHVWLVRDHSEPHRSGSTYG
jgi:hypothetical protein